MSDRSRDSDVDVGDATGVGIPGASEANDRPPTGPVPGTDPPGAAPPPSGGPPPPGAADPPGHPSEPSEGSSFPPDQPPPGSPQSDSAVGESPADEGAPAGSIVADDVDQLEQNVVDDLGVLEKERDEYLDALRRLQADFDNFRKRMVRQQTETLERAAEDLVAKLLPVLDAVDLARQHGGDGVDQIAGALFDVLSKEGLERLGEEGEPFDPNIHEAVAHEDGDGQPVIAQVMRPGYRWRQRLLRAAMVTVKG